MLRDGIKGLDKIFVTDTPKGSVILVMGAIGTLKSGFVHNVLSNNLSRRNDEYGLYFTLEESKESHLRNMRSLGIKRAENMMIIDYHDSQRKYGKMMLNIMEMIMKIIESHKKEHGDKFTYFALDSLNAMCALVKTEKKREDMYNLFNILRENDLTSFIAMETPTFNVLEWAYGFEGFLADGVVELGLIETHEDVIRYVQVKKMRATQHSMKKYQLTIEPDGLAVLGPAYER